MGISRALLCTALVALLAASAFAIPHSEYDQNIAAMAQALQKTGDYSVYGSRIQQYYMGPFVHPYSQNVMTVFVPTNKAIKAFRNYPQPKWPKMAHFLMAEGSVTVDQLAAIPPGQSLRSAEGCPIFVVSKPGDKTIAISGAKNGAVTAKIVKPNLFTSSTLTAHGIDAVPLPCDL